mmetsp:Transcript_11245/g.26878  ORF Transcript_11245/g.26878 Transcript_11245/m.26878 type:complete len:203 (+) Transcript_11245:2170-2778(+)
MVKKSGGRICGRSVPSSTSRSWSKTAAICADSSASPASSSGSSVSSATGASTGLGRSELGPTSPSNSTSPDAPIISTSSCSKILFHASRRASACASSQGASEASTALEVSTTVSSIGTFLPIVSGAMGPGAAIDASNLMNCAAKSGHSTLANSVGSLPTSGLSGSASGQEKRIIPEDGELIAPARFFLVLDHVTSRLTGVPG